MTGAMVALVKEEIKSSWLQRLLRRRRRIRIVDSVSVSCAAAAQRDHLDFCNTFAHVGLPACPGRGKRTASFAKLFVGNAEDGGVLGARRLRLRSQVAALRPSRECGKQGRGALRPISHTWSVVSGGGHKTACSNVLSPQNQAWGRPPQRRQQERRRFDQNLSARQTSHLRDSHRRLSVRGSGREAADIRLYQKSVASAR
jgi:hypothetical protein